MPNLPEFFTANVFFHTVLRSMCKYMLSFKSYEHKFYPINKANTNHISTTRTHTNSFKRSVQVLRNCATQSCMFVLLESVSYFITCQTLDGHKGACRLHQKHDVIYLNKWYIVLLYQNSNKR